MLVGCHLSALTGVTWTDVGQAGLSDVHAKLTYIIEPPEPSSLTRSPMEQHCE